MPSSSSSPPYVTKKSYKDVLTASSAPAKADKKLLSKKKVSPPTPSSPSPSVATIVLKNTRSKKPCTRSSRINLMPTNKQKKPTTVTAETESSNSPIKPPSPSSMPSTPEPPTSSPSPPPFNGPSPPPTPPLPELPDLKSPSSSPSKKSNRPHYADSYIGLQSLVECWMWVNKGNGRKSREKVRGVVIEVIGKRQWKVQFDGGDTCIKHSNSLTLLQKVIRPNEPGGEYLWYVPSDDEVIHTNKKMNNEKPSLSSSSSSEESEEGTNIVNSCYSIEDEENIVNNFIKSHVPNDLSKKRSSTPSKSRKKKSTTNEQSNKNQSFPATRKLDNAMPELPVTTRSVARKERREGVRTGSKKVASATTKNKSCPKTNRKTSFPSSDTRRKSDDSSQYKTSKATDRRTSSMKKRRTSSHDTSRSRTTTNTASLTTPSCPKITHFDEQEENEELVDEERLAQRHARRRKLAQEEINSTIGKIVICSDSAKGKLRQPDIRWEQISEEVPQEDVRETRDVDTLGIKDHHFIRYLDRETDFPLAHLFIHLSYKNGDVHSIVDTMNSHVHDYNEKLRANHRNIYSSTYQQSNDSDSNSSVMTDDDMLPPKIHPRKPNKRTNKARIRTINPFNMEEFFVFLALLVNASDSRERGINLWSQSRRNGPSISSTSIWRPLVPSSSNYGQYMTLTRFKEMKMFYPKVWESAESRLAGDPWWKIILAIKQFNENRNFMIRTSNDICVDEIMSAYKPSASAYGGLPHLNLVLGKPKDFGIEMKVSLY